MVDDVAHAHPILGGDSANRAIADGIELVEYIARHGPQNVGVLCRRDGGKGLRRVRGHWKRCMVERARSCEARCATKLVTVLGQLEAKRFEMTILFGNLLLSILIRFCSLFSVVECKSSMLSTL